MVFPSFQYRTSSECISFQIQCVCHKCINEQHCCSITTMKTLTVSILLHPAQNTQEADLSAAGNKQISLYVKLKSREQTCIKKYL